MVLQFQETYGKPLVAARDSKCSAKDAEAGVLAMEVLHKQVFISSFSFSFVSMCLQIVSGLSQEILLFYFFRLCLSFFDERKMKS